MPRVEQTALPFDSDSDGGGSDVAPVVVSAEGASGDALLVARYGAGWRYTANPPTRREAARRGESAGVWDAGPVEEWCEVPGEASLDSLSRAVEVALASQPGAGRVERQRAVHSVTPCVRRRTHWTERDALG